MVSEGDGEGGSLWFGHGSLPPRPGQARLVLRNVTKLVRICQTEIGGEGILLLCAAVPYSVRRPWVGS